MVPARSIEDLVYAAGKAIGRSGADCDPFINILKDNWFDSPESLESTATDELCGLGIPLRFAQQITNLAKGPNESARPSTADDAPIRAAGKGGNGRTGRVGRGRSPIRASAGLRSGVLPPKYIKVRDYEPAFMVRGSILGHKGRNVHYIQDETKVKVELRGESPMEIVLTNAPNAQALESAYQMTKHLLTTVAKEYQDWQRERTGKGKGGGKGPEVRFKGASARMTVEECEFKHTIDVDEVDANFPIRAKVIGSKGCNIKHIETSTGAAVHLIGGKGGERMVVDLGASTQDGLNKAVLETESILSNVYASYDRFLANGKLDDDDAPEPRNRKRRAVDMDGVPARGDAKFAVDDCPFKHSIEIDEMDEAFPARAKIIGLRGCNVKQIETSANATVHLKGGKDGERFVIDLGASSEEDMSAAISEAETILAQVYESYEKWLENGGLDDEDGGVIPAADKSGRRGRRRDREPAIRNTDIHDSMEIDVVCDDPNFSVRGKILGKGASRLNEIQQRTGSRIDMKTTDAGTVRLDVAASNQDCLDSTMLELQKLADYVSEEHERFLQDGAAERPGRRSQKGKGKGGSGGKGSVSGGKGSGGKGKNETVSQGGNKRILKLRHTDPEFDIKRRIRGKSCVNLHHIQDGTGAQVWIVGGEGGEPIRLEISGDKGFDQALGMAKDLVKAVFREYDTWKRTADEPASKRQRM